MGYRYLSSRAASPVGAWVAISLSPAEDLGKLKVPVLDLYGQHDLPAVLKNAPIRAPLLKGRAGSRQQKIAVADHFYEGREDALLEAVQGFLEQAL